MDFSAGESKEVVGGKIVSDIESGRIYSSAYNEEEEAVWSIGRSSITSIGSASIAFSMSTLSPAALPPIDSDDAGLNDLLLSLDRGETPLMTCINQGLVSNEKHLSLSP